MSQSDEKESIARTQLPYRAEYCKTSRAKCKKCSEPMVANTLKLAIMTKSRFHDGFDASWHHVACFFRIKRPSSVAEIRHFETLKYEDQKTLEQAVETKGQSVLGGIKVEEQDLEINKKGSKKAGKKRGADIQGSSDQLVNYEDFMVEYAKSGRASCLTCGQKIEKASVRLGRMDYSAETPNNVGPVPRWYHVDCFAKSLDQLEFYGYIEKIKNFDQIEEDDQKMLKKKIKFTTPKADLESPMKKMKVDPEEEKALKKQSDRLFALREFLNTMRRKDIELLLDSMDQKSDFKAPSVLVDMAADVLLFGPIEKCPKCKRSKGMVLRGNSYICTNGQEIDPCTYETHKPRRGLPLVPDELVEKYAYFETRYKFRGGDRIFPSKFVKAVEQKEAEDNKIVQDGAPLLGLSIGVISWTALKNDKDKLQKKIVTLGGKVSTVLDRGLFVVLTNKNEVEKNSPKMEVAKGLELPLVSDDFIFSITTKEDIVPQLKKNLVDTWDGDLNDRLAKHVAMSKS